MKNARISLNEARKITKNNKYRTFTRGVSGDSGAERISNEFPDIAYKPKFKLNKDDLFFTIGSCFARNIEKALDAYSVKNFTSECVISGDLYELAGPDRNGALNAYTPASMLSLVKFWRREDKELVGSLPIGGGAVVDMMTSGLKHLQEKDFHDVRSKLISTYQKLPEADVVIITLGYTEAWFDREHKIHINNSPGSKKSIIAKGERYEFDDLDAFETVEYVQQIVDEIQNNSLKDVKIIVTVSPVPLHRTWGEKDVVTANLVSKSKLIAAANYVSGKYEHVDYFPSYEMVMYGDPSKTWMPDGVHVKNEKVEKVISRFYNSYFI